ncbi:EAL domain-containing protein [Methylomonas sp. AM2-LC]|uniref:putative bifunctional diguanylate cyclase/phosphodiesterase n=1 Tax=Methylomonas sp. AM2-LC TaxID=3153301 RepID=UPI003264DD29
MMFFPIDSFDIALNDVKKQPFGEDEFSFSVRHLLIYVEPISIKTRCVEVLDHFISNEELLAVVIIDKNHIPVGIIDRGRMTEIFLRPFARDLLHKTSIAEIMDAHPIIVDINANIDDISKIILDAGMRHMVSGFIVLEDGIYVGMATGHALLECITLRRQRDLYMLAHYDQLTGLPNRLLFNDRLQQACQNAARNKTVLALVFVDLDRFKFINDSMGHSFGDRLLMITAERLLSSVRQSDTVARLGGDEFVVILQNINHQTDAEAVLLTIIDQLQLPMPVFGRDIKITASMGMAFYPKHAEDIDGLIRKADAAMYEVKERGRNAYMIYSPEMESGKISRMGVETQLRMALEANEFSLFFQPQIRLSDRQIIGVEALLRWHHPHLGMVSPATFIPIAEETGLIVPIGEWVLRAACLQQLRWQQQGLPALRMAVNISALQFQQPAFCQQVKSIIQDTGIDAQYLELELTESGIMKRAELAVQTLNELGSQGVKLAIDDFGTGYSSLSYLGKFPIDRIKIDQSFIRNIENTPANQAIVKAIIALADNLGLQTVAEGVETVAELNCALAYHCHEVQGYYFAKPMAEAELVSWYQQY